VAIIAILAAIAVPNFLEAQVRSKVSRVLAEHRHLKIGLESYRVDYNKYPPQHRDAPPQFPEIMTTPIAYISSVQSALDIFKDKAPNGIAYIEYYWKVYHYWYWKSYFGTFPQTPLELFRASPRVDSFLFYSWGPDQTRDWVEYYGPYGNSVESAPIPPHYDPSNGTVSRGDIITYGP